MKIGPIRIATAHTLSMGLAVVLCSAVAVGAQEPAAPRPPIGRPVVDPAAHDRGRALWATHCVQCHGPQARGSDTGPNIIRTKTVNYDRSAAQAGSVLGPFLKAGHPTQSRSRARRSPTTRSSPRELPAAARQRHDARVAPLHGGRHRHRQRQARRGVLQRRRRLRHVPHRLGAQPRRHRHAHSRPVDLQQRMLFPDTRGRGRGGRGRGAAPAARRAGRGPPARDRNAVTVSIASGSGARSRVSWSRRATST